MFEHLSKEAICLMFVYDAIQELSEHGYMECEGEQISPEGRRQVALMREAGLEPTQGEMNAMIQALIDCGEIEIQREGGNALGLN